LKKKTRPMKVIVGAFLALMMFMAPALAVEFQHLLAAGPDHQP
jgi:hypothetical protein